ncbi:MAG: GNAT family N-acetyltransferase, partial [Halobacteriovoraceae bacterium]|nr:GNAT family N-acetyltransferase [Halobacteriovoraceae bacterium]
DKFKGSLEEVKRVSAVWADARVLEFSGSLTLAQKENKNVSYRIQSLPNGMLDEHLWLVRDGLNIAGFFRVLIEDGEKVIDRIYLGADYRGSGIGNKVMQFILSAKFDELAKLRSYNITSLYVLAESKYVRWYESFEFEKLAGIVDEACQFKDELESDERVIPTGCVGKYTLNGLPYYKMTK